jgi:hypothetical protein
MVRIAWLLRFSTTIYIFSGFFILSGSFETTSAISKKYLSNEVADVYKGNTGKPVYAH